MSAESFGMMSDAYFVGRQQLVQWVNDLLDLNIKKVEECAPGAIYCQIVDSIFPGKIAIKRCDFNYHYEHEYLKNYKVLQDSFKKLGLEKVIPVDRLVKSRHQDNLEFLQWMYMWYQNCVGTDEVVEYDGYKRRCMSKNGKTFKSNRTAAKKPARASTRASSTRSTASTRAAPARSTATTRTGSTGARASGRSQVSTTRASSRGGARAGAAASRNSGVRKGATRAGAAAAAAASSKADPDPALVKELGSVKQQKDELEKEFEELTSVAKDLEKERDFYFNKILTIETLVKEQQDDSNKAVMAKILEVLYSTDESAAAADGDDAGDAPAATEDLDADPIEEEPEPEAQGSGFDDDEEALQGDDEDLDAVLAHEEELLAAEEAEAAQQPADNSDLITDDDLLAEDFGDEFGGDDDGDEDLLF